MLTKRQQQVLKVMVKHGALGKTSRGLWQVVPADDYPTPQQTAEALDDDLKLGFVAPATVYALAHHGLVAFVDAYTVSPTPKGEALAALLDETTMVTRRGAGVVIS